MDNRVAPSKDLLMNVGKIATDNINNMCLYAKLNTIPLRIADDIFTALINLLNADDRDNQLSTLNVLLSIAPVLSSPQCNQLLAELIRCIFDGYREWDVRMDAIRLVQAIASKHDLKLLPTLINCARSLASITHLADNEIFLKVMTAVASQLTPPVYAAYFKNIVSTLHNTTYPIAALDALNARAAYLATAEINQIFDLLLIQLTSADSQLSQTALNVLIRIKTKLTEEQIGNAITHIFKHLTNNLWRLSEKSLFFLIELATELNFSFLNLVTTHLFNFLPDRNTANLDYALTIISEFFAKLNDDQVGFIVNSILTKLQGLPFQQRAAISALMSMAEKLEPDEINVLIRQLLTAMPFSPEPMQILAAELIMKFVLMVGAEACLAVFPTLLNGLINLDSTHMYIDDSSNVPIQIKSLIQIFPVLQPAHLELVFTVCLALLESTKFGAVNQGLYGLKHLIPWLEAKQLAVCFTLLMREAARALDCAVRQAAWECLIQLAPKMTCTQQPLFLVLLLQTMDDPVIEIRQAIFPALVAALGDDKQAIATLFEKELLKLSIPDWHYRVESLSRLTSLRVKFSPQQQALFVKKLIIYLTDCESAVGLEVLNTLMILSPKLTSQQYAAILPDLIGLLSTKESLALQRTAETLLGYFIQQGKYASEQLQVAGLRYLPQHLLIQCMGQWATQIKSHRVNSKERVSQINQEGMFADSPAIEDTKSIYTASSAQP